MSSLPFRAIGIFSRPRRADITDIVRPLLDWLAKRGIRAVYDTETAASLRDGTEGRPRELLAHESDLLLVLGGDGTLLAAAREAAPRRYDGHRQDAARLACNTQDSRGVRYGNGGIVARWNRGPASRIAGARVRSSVGSGRRWYVACGRTGRRAARDSYSAD